MTLDAARFCVSPVYRVIGQELTWVFTQRFAARCLLGRGAALDVLNESSELCVRERLAAVYLVPNAVFYPGSVAIAELIKSHAADTQFGVVWRAVCFD